MVKYLLEMPDDVWEQFKQKAKEIKTPMRQIIEFKIREFIENDESFTVKFNQN